MPPKRKGGSKVSPKRPSTVQFVDTSEPTVERVEEKSSKRATPSKSGQFIADAERLASDRRAHLEKEASELLDRAIKTAEEERCRRQESSWDVFTRKKALHRIQDASLAAADVSLADDSFARAPAQSDIKPAAPPAKATAFPIEGCSEHDGAPFVAYCFTCARPVCAVCVGIQHTVAANHRTEPLVDFVHFLVDNVSCVRDHNQNIASQLDNLLDGHAAAVSKLHTYVDSEIDSLLAALERKRVELHCEVEQRQQTSSNVLEAELETCEEALSRLVQGREVLDALGLGSGIVPGHMGGILHGTLSYDAFLAECDAPLSDPPRVLEQLMLQLPVQSLQEVCDMVTWTEASVTGTPQIFPK